MTGLHLGISGDAPCVVCAAVVTPPALEVHAEAGLPANAELHVYRSIEEYLPLLSRLIAHGYRLAGQRVHPENEIPPAAAHALPALVRRLNDKGRMEELVPAEWLPSRRTIPAQDLPDGSTLLANGLPVVLKAATEKPSGGGHGVWICRTLDDVEGARRALAGQDRVVLEEFLDFVTTVCVHNVVFPDGSSALIGLAEEIVSNGRWLGNWHDAEGDRVPPAAIAAVNDVVAAAAALGYRGITGIDVALLRDGTWRVLDLNFRVNGSTAGAWLRASLEQARGVRVLRGCSWTGARGFDAMVQTVRAAVRRGTMIPLGLYDPDACSMAGAARTGGLLLGDSRAEIEEERRRLAREGLE